MAKVFQVNYSICVKDKDVSTNTLKAGLSGLFSMGGDAVLISSSLSPMTFSTPIENFLSSKTEYRLYEGEAWVLLKKDEFAGGDKLTAGNYQKKLTDCIQSLSDKNGNLYEIEIIAISCKRI